jgi:predicted aldo/keto reductase-like oxidoreductase
MRYRPFGKLDFKVSALGFGAMRLPTKEGKVDMEESTRMLRTAIDRGVNYVDTAWPYHGGESETFVGRALKDGYREKVKVATKMPCWEVKSAADFDKYLDAQLKRLDLPFLDFYLLHSLNKDSWPKMRDLGVIPWAEKAMKDGRFRHLAFSFHDDYDAFKKIIDAYDWPMCQIQYNYMDVENGATRKGLEYAASKGIAVVVMEPLLGGRLVKPPAPIQSLWDGAAVKRSPAGWALEWLWSQGGVSTVLSGMSAMDQVRENLDLADVSRVGSLSAEELALVDRVRERYRGLIVIPCTNCRYCMPCAQHVDIPGNFGAYNDGIMYDKPNDARGTYGWWKYAYEVQHMNAHDVRAAACIQCGECEEKCPQKIPISSWMPVIHSVLGEGKPWVKSPGSADA